MHVARHCVEVGGSGTALVVGFGFIGRHVCRLANERGAVVRVLARRDVSVPAGVELVVGDAADPGVVKEALRGVRHVVYAAGTARPAESALDPRGECDANLSPVLTVLDAIVAADRPHLTFLSSGGTVYGPSAPDPATEDAALWPISPYGVVKVAAERFIGMYAQVHGISVDVLRCANVYGPGQPTGGSQGAIGVFGAALAAGEEITVFGDGSAIRDFVHVEDVADVALRLGSQPDGLRILNVGSGESVTILELIDLLAARIGVMPVVRYQLARPSDGPVARLDISRLQEAIEFAPRDLAAGLATMNELAVSSR